MNINIIWADFVNGAKTHFGKQGNPCFYRVQLKLANLVIFIQEYVE